MNVIRRALLVGILVMLPGTAGAGCPEDLRATGHYASVLKQSRDQYEQIVAQQADQIKQLEQQLRALTEKPPVAPAPDVEKK